MDNKYTITEDMLSIPQIKSGTIYHYTSAEGLMGIINGEIWATDSDFMNDRKELKLGIEILTEIINNNVDDKEACEYITRSVRNEINGVGRLGEFGDKRYRNFIISCSEARDSMTMWSTYSSYMGYCMEFDFEKLIQNFNGHVLHGKVVYDHDQQVKHLKDYIENVMFTPDFREAAAAGWEDIRIGNEEVLSYFAMDVGIACSLCNMFYKDSSFENEREYRFVFFDRIPDKDGKKDFPLHFRTKGEIIIPFIKYKFNSGSSFGLKQVIIGPTNNSDISKEGLELFLKYNRIQAKTVKSDVPIRY